MGSIGVAHPQLYLGQAHGSRPKRKAFPVKFDSLGLGSSVWGRIKVVV